MDTIGNESTSLEEPTHQKQQARSAVKFVMHNEDA